MIEASLGKDADDVGAAFDVHVPSFDGIWRMRFRQMRPADAYLGRAEAIMAERDKIERSSIATLRLQRQPKAA